MWNLIRKAEWAKDHDYERIGQMYLKLLPKIDCIQLFEFIRDRVDELGAKLRPSQQRNYAIWQMMVIIMKILYM